MTELPTVGERLAGRRLHKHLRSGVEHFRTGQMAAKRTDEDPDVYELSWVTHMGHVASIICIWAEDEWVVLPVYMKAGQVTAFQERLPADFELTDGMRERLEEARSAPVV
jgi:hypothetical protein